LTFTYNSHRPFSQDLDDGVGASGFDRYKDAFDNFMSGMSEEEVRAASGTAALVGSIIGSVVAGRIASRGASGRGGGGLLAGAVSLIGSKVGAVAGSSLVESVHQSSIQTKDYERRKDEALRRGEIPPEKPKGGLETLFEGAAGAFSAAGNVNNHTGGRGSTRSGSGGLGFMEAAKAAMDIAGSLAEELRNQNHQRRQY